MLGGNIPPPNHRTSRVRFTLDNFPTKNRSERKRKLANNPRAPLAWTPRRRLLRRRRRRCCWWRTTTASTRQGSASSSTSSSPRGATASSSARPTRKMPPLSPNRLAIPPLFLLASFRFLACLVVWLLLCGYSALGSRDFGQWLGRSRQVVCEKKKKKRI